jgi:hypothetical protein
MLRSLIFKVNNSLCAFDGDNKSETFSEKAISIFFGDFYLKPAFCQNALSGLF